VRLLTKKNIVIRKKKLSFKGLVTKAVLNDETSNRHKRKREEFVEKEESSDDEEEQEEETKSKWFGLF
jgi:hypothetical protein